METALADLKRRIGFTPDQEIKPRDALDERSYFAFLEIIDSLDGLLFAVLVDMGDHDATSIRNHRDEQAGLVSADIDDLEIDADGRERLQVLADRISGLSEQLYVQLQCQIWLVEQIIRYATLYFVLRHPRAASGRH